MDSKEFYIMQLETGGSITEDREIVCPHCFYSDSDYFDRFDLSQDGDTTEVKCGSCGKDFNVEISISVEFTTTKKAESLN